MKFNHTPIPEKLLLYPAYPNPFNPTATFRFDIPFLDYDTQNISLIIFDVKGRKVEILKNESIIPGSHEVKWNAQNHSTGIYFAKLTYGDFIQTQKVIYLK